MNTKHTPGPWTAHGCTVYQNDQWQDGKNLGGKQVARAYPDPLESDSMPTEEDGANSRLIAAAPELLKACQDAILLAHPCPECGHVELLGHGLARCPCADRPWDIRSIGVADKYQPIMDAIAKAQGEA